MQDITIVREEVEVTLGLRFIQSERFGLLSKTKEEAFLVFNQNFLNFFFKHESYASQNMIASNEEKLRVPP